MADTTPAFGEIDVLILNNRIKEAIDALFRLLAGRKAFQSIYDDLLVVAANYHNVAREEAMLLIPYEDRRVTRSQLVKALIGLKTAAMATLRNDPALQAELSSGANAPLGYSITPDARSSQKPFREITDDVFAQTIRIFNAEIEALTQEQFNVIQYLRYEKRVRISGTAGSGKTLVAAEKAIRLAASGVRVLFLCHNPLLADRVRQALRGQQVDIIDFCTWVDNLLHIEEPRDPNFGWTHYQEPDPQSLNAALDVLATHYGEKYDAIIVDEGQDFREEWWLLIEAALKEPGKSVFYIFHDNNQSLLMHRSVYPIKNPVIDLSKNCRNAGRIHDLMRIYDQSAVESSARLRDKGEVELVVYQKGNEPSVLSEILAGIHKDGLLDNTALLVGNQIDLSRHFLSNKRIAFSTFSRWQDEVRKQFNNIFTVYNQIGIELPRVLDGAKILDANLRGLDPRSPEASRRMILEELKQLSNAPYPTDEDAALVSMLARRFTIEHRSRKHIEENPKSRNAFYWHADNNQVALWCSHKKPGGPPVWSAEVLLFFQDPDWPDGLPKPVDVTLAPYYTPLRSNVIRMYNIADFKGLESEVVILFIQGKIPRFREAVYVGVSRATYKLIVVSDNAGLEVLPKAFNWDRVVG